MRKWQMAGLDTGSPPTARLPWAFYRADEAIYTATRGDFPSATCFVVAACPSTPHLPRSF
jgi:hypothetical protein